MVNTKNNTNPALDEMNALLALFNQQKLPEALALASSMAQQYPKHGFAWKVLGAIYQNQGLTDQALDALKNAALYLPDDYEAQYNLGNCYYDQQQLDAAVKFYQKSIRLNPQFVQAHYNLGNVFKNQNLLAQAEESYKKALQFDANNIWVLDNLGHVLYEQGQFDAAKDCYKKILKVDPGFVSAHIGLGAIAKGLGDLNDAEDYFKKAIQLGAQFEAYSNLADLLKQTDRLEEAEKCISAGILAHPKSVDAYLKMAIHLRNLGQVFDSIPYFTEALSLDNTRKDVYVELGLAKAGLGDLSEAEQFYHEAIKLDSEYWQAYNNLGLVLHRMNRNQEAEIAFNKALTLHPDDALIYSNLSLALSALGMIKKAEIALKKALEIDPSYLNAHINLCTNYIAQGRLDEAEAACFEALKYDPTSDKVRSNLLFTMNYSGHHSAEHRLQQALAFDQVVASKVKNPYTSWQSKPESRRLRIGLMSGDLRQHPVAYFLENWVRHVDYAKFELTAYLTDAREDAFTGRLKPNFSYWKSLVGLTDQAAAELIHQDGIDILLDLSGHTSGNRLQILAWKPAPIQVSWLGYFATTGMNTVDYFIADTVGVPESHQSQFVEKIKYLPDTRLCFTAPHVAIKVSPLPALANGYVTFASFQTFAKAGDEVLALWAKAMLAVPNSKLRWQCKSLADAEVSALVVTKFAKLGISADRLILLGSVLRDAYFASHHEVDLILDTFPYPGGTTTCEALWMGVPTLTLAGDSLIARQGASMLTAAGLAEWVAETKTEYLEKALAHCSDLKRLSNLRAGLREKVLASPLFDAERFAKNMEIGLLAMWHEHFPEISEGDVTPEALSPITEIKYKPLTREGYEQKIKGNHNNHIVIVSATRYSEQEFWEKSALGLSLHRHIKQDGKIAVNVAFNNTLGLSTVFNRAIELAGERAILVFVHDDVWIDEANFSDTLVAGLAHFDVIGVAGNKRRLPNQPAWLFTDTAMTWDAPEYLSGTVSHGQHAFGEDKYYGEVPAECELLDGVFLATKKSVLDVTQVRFDPQFDFHLYDIDFCRSARAAGLHLGTWAIKLTHQSEGAFGSPHWAQKCQLYFNKWESNSPQQQALHNAMNEVMQVAQQHEVEGQFEQAAALYHEVLGIQPDNAEANYRLGIVIFNLHGVHEAIPLLEKAVQSKPEDEQYWVTYIDALMQSADVATVLEALELGQQFGLTAETAQQIAADFMAQMDAEAQPAATSPDSSNQVIKQCLLEVLTTNIHEVNSASSKADISPHLDLSTFETTINALFSANQHNEILSLIYKAISAIKLQPEFVGTKVFTPYFDQVLESMNLGLTNVVARERKLANIVIASEVYDYGGHTKVIQEILATVENPILIITDIYDRFAKNHLFEKVAPSFACPVMLLPSEAYLDKAKRLAAFINSCAKNVFILSHHEDAVAIAACQKTLDTKYYFVHHADHNPALGSTVAHFNHVDLFEPMAKLCAEDLKKTVVCLPTSSHDYGAKTFNYPIQQFSTVTAGSAGKFAMSGELSLGNIVRECLKTCGGKHYHFGELAAEQVQMIRDQLTQDDLDPELFVYMGNVPSLWDGLRTIDAHIFIGSVPTPGYKASLEAAGVAYPLLSYVPIDRHRYLHVGAGEQAGQSWTGVDELISGLKHVMHHHHQLSQESRRYYLSCCSSHTFEEKIAKLCHD